MFELHQLEQLIAIKECGTISKAAENLHISQPALTRSIQKLEESLNIKLFERSKNRITLNQTGELAVKCAQKVVEEADNMIEKINNFERTRHTISIGSCAPAPLCEIMPLLGRHYPGMSIISEMKTKDILLLGLFEDIYQIIITTEPVEQDDICSIKFCEEHLYISVPPAHPLSTYKEVSFDELNGESFLLFSQIGFWHQMCKEKMPDSLFLIQDQATALNELIKMSALPNFVSDLSLKQGREINNRIMIPIINPEANVTFYCSFKKTNTRKYKKIFNV